MAYIEKRGKTWRYSISYVDDEGNRKKFKKVVIVLNKKLNELQKI